jgi:hypothetical protein
MLKDTKKTAKQIEMLGDIPSRIYPMNVMKNPDIPVASELTIRKTRSLYTVEHKLDPTVLKHFGYIDSQSIITSAVITNI